MIEIRFHSRAGQGAKTVALFLSGAFGKAGKFVQAFPDFGPEREGAPMKAYVRIDDNPIRIVEGIKEPEFVLIVDETLLSEPEVHEGLNDKTVIIVNSCISATKVKKENKLKGKVCTIDANGISERKIGKQIPNTVMLGALVKIMDDKKVTIEKLAKFVEESFEKKLGKKLAKANAMAVKEGFRELKNIK